MTLPWQVRRFIAVIVGGVLALTFGLWGPVLVGLLAWLTGMSGTGGYGPATGFTLPGMVLGGLICSVPAAAGFVCFVVGDAAEATGRGRDAGRRAGLPPERVRHFVTWRTAAWLLVFGMLVGMMFSMPDLFDSWSRALGHLVDRGDPDLGAAERTAVAAMVQSFPVGALGLFLWSLATAVMPTRLNRSPHRDTWVPWRAFGLGSVVWLVSVVASVLPAYLGLA